jgi:hypothetical protein
MGQQPVMWTYIRPTKPKFHLRYKNMALKVTTQEEAHQRRPNMEPRGMLTTRIHLENPLVREMKAPRNCPVVDTSSHFQRRRKRRKHSKIHEPEEFKKSKPPTFDGDIKKGEEAEAWILGLKKYFRVHDYENLKARITILNLNGKASIWWEDLRNVKGIHEKEPCNGRNLRNTSRISTFLKGTMMKILGVL